MSTAPVVPPNVLPARRNTSILIVVVFIIAILSIFAGLFWLRRSPRPTVAPEAEQILRSQAALPFQVLMPAYLPPKFNRKKVDIQTDQAGPQGEAMLRLAYPASKGQELVIYEWMPASAPAVEGVVTGATNSLISCPMMASMGAQSALAPALPQEAAQNPGFTIQKGALRVHVGGPAWMQLTYEQAVAILNTLGPAANRQSFSTLEQIPVDIGFPPSTPVEVGPDGVQEVVLIVSSSGYTPAHFSLKKGVPARLVFRLLGEVGCGNELIFTWGKKDQADLLLAGPDDTKTLEFIPQTEGDFVFHCPHDFYRGLLTVEE